MYSKQSSTSCSTVQQFVTTCPASYGHVVKDCCMVQDDAGDRYQAIFLFILV